MKNSIKISDTTFTVNNCTGFSDATIKKHFVNFINEHDCPVEYVAKDNGTQYSAHVSHAKGEKFRFLPSI